jgi:hypothetical protein
MRMRPKLMTLARLRARAAAWGMLAGLLPALGVPALDAAAQAPGHVAREELRARASITGAVLDAATGAPLENATLVLQPEVLGAFPAGPATGSAFTAGVRALLSDARGEYRFDDLPAGVYRVYASRLGYRPYSVVVELRGGAGAPVAIGLVAEPIPLRALETVAHGRGPYEAADAFGADLDLARLVAAEQSRRRFLTTDARELTHADVIEAITLGEPDVMRALQRLPGVTTRSDYTAELWTRGAPWSQTRVYFDGVPLYNPLHALGIVSGIGSNAIGAVWFHPGARSAAIGEGAAGVIDLQSRRASGDGELNVHADLSLVSAGLALDQRVHGGRAGWMLAGRQTYVDWLTGLANRAAGRDGTELPYGFSEVAGRVDAWLAPRTVLEASWLWERDHLTSTVPDEPASIRADWGNTAGRVSLGSHMFGLNLRHTVAASAHAARVMPDTWRAAWEAGQVPLAGSSTRRESDTRVDYVGFSGTVWPEPTSLAGPAWSLGYALERHSARYIGPQVLPVPRLAVSAPTMDRGFDSVRMDWVSDLPQAVAWLERSWHAADRLGVKGGLRAEVSDALANTGPVRLAPRLAVRYAASPEVALSAGVSRVFQYTQAVAPGGIYVASLASADVWLVAGPHVPAIRSDIATLGLETWLAPGRVATLNAFGRRAGGMTVPDPRPGRVFDRPTFVVGENTAYGGELSVRQITGRVTGSASYTLSRSEMQAAGLRYRAASDRRHVLSATTMLRATSSLRAGAGFTAATGVPYTVTIASADECLAVAGCDPGQLPWMATPHGDRAPTFASLDLLLDWTTRVRGFELGAWAQLRNALGRDNATVYTGGHTGCPVVGCGDELESTYERGMPRLPVLGLRVRR